MLPSLGSPSGVQIAALAGAIVVEMGLIAFVVTRFRDRDPSTLILAILFVVGPHFLIMGLAHGPLIAALGILTTATAGLGLRTRSIPLPAIGITDAILKLGFGVWMPAFYPAFTYAAVL